MTHKDLTFLQDDARLFKIPINIILFEDMIHWIYIQQTVTWAAVMEAAGSRIIQFGFRIMLSIFKPCSLKISETTTTKSNFICLYKTQKVELCEWLY